MITHHSVPARQWQAFKMFYGDYQPTAALIVHRAGVHGPEICIETSTRRDADYVHNKVVRSDEWAHSIVTARITRLKKDRNRRLRSDRVPA